MATIHILDQQTINQIAAGEVIERPASVVKELTENAVDAGASAVTVEIKEGGISFIRVTDNGCGIEKSQVPVAFLRHTTSKIKSSLDLLTVSSLGFRGEALSSIAAVSQVELITKVSEELTGTRYLIRDGKEQSIEEIGAPEGTTFLVRNLFDHTPARKKFLKTPQTEAGYVSVLIERMALSRPDISFRLIVNNQTRLHSAGNHKVKDLIYQIYGRETAANLIPVSAQFPGMKLTGFIGKPVLSRGNRNYENYFVNGRYVRSNIVGKAIEDAYQGRLMQHKYPFTVLYLSIEPDQIDVNVHPAKMELRFADNEQVYRNVFDAITEAFSEKELIPKVELEEAALTDHSKPQKNNTVSTDLPEPFEKNRLAGLLRETGIYRQYPEQTDKQQNNNQQAGKQSDRQQADRQLNLFEEKLLTPAARMKYRFIGQLFDTYWLIQSGDELMIMDQHAAHEKVLFEQYMKKIRQKTTVYSQAMNPPAVISLSVAEEELLNCHMDEFNRAGFEIEPFGGREYALCAMPADLPKINPEDFFRDLLDRLSDCSGKDSTMILETIASMSCKAAVKGNHSMSLQEAEKLIDELMTLDNPFACPHGRPTIIRISKYELEKKFSRVVS